MYKLANTETGQFTRIKLNEFGHYDYEGAINRLISRAMPGYYAGSTAHYNFSEQAEFDVEICRSCGDLQEHTGERISFKISQTPAPQGQGEGERNGTINGKEVFQQWIPDMGRHPNRGSDL